MKDRGPRLSADALAYGETAESGDGMTLVYEATALANGKPRLLDQVREAIRARHYSRRTEESYVAWIRRFILFHGKRHPKEMGSEEIAAFLSALAVKGKVSSSTQNQAFCALLFLYRQVLKIELRRVEDVVRAKVPRRLPVVLTRDEVGKVLDHLNQQQVRC